MSRSRKRKKQSAGPDRLRRRRGRDRRKIKEAGGAEPCPCGCGGRTIPSERLAQTLDDVLTPEDLEWAHRQADAEARGDAKGALEAYQQSVHVSGNIWPVHLDYLARAGNDAPEWLIARWVRAQAVRWMILNEDRRLHSCIMDALLTHDLPAEITPEWLYERGALVAANDLLCHDLALHAEGGLADFLDLRATEELLARAGRVREWPNHPLGVYEYLDIDRDVLTVRDIATGDHRDVLHLGAVTGLDRDARVFGRLVPVVTSPGTMFEHRPIEVDSVTARQLAGELDDGSVEGLFGILASAARAGRMPWRPGTRVGTYLWSDALIVDERFEELVASEPEAAEPGAFSGWIRDRMDDGVLPEIAIGLATCQMALDLAEVVPDSLPVTATHAATNLSVPAILEAAREHLTQPETANAWRIMSDYVQEPLRSQCRELADVADGRRSA